MTDAAWRTRYIAFCGRVPEEFQPVLDGEHDAAAWVPSEELAWEPAPYPLHRGIALVLFTFYARFA